MTTFHANRKALPDRHTLSQIVAEMLESRLQFSISFGVSTQVFGDTYQAGVTNGHVTAFPFDLNGDTKPDLVITDNPGTTSTKAATVDVELNNTHVVFGSPVVAYTAGLHNSLNIFPADLNGDGKPDLIVQETTATGSLLKVLINKGTGAFNAAVQIYSVTTPKINLQVADLNGDSKNDILVNTQPATGAPTLVSLINKGTGAFNAAATILTGTAGQTLTENVADLNGDGKKDLVVKLSTPTTAKVETLINKGTGAFNAPTVLFTESAGSVDVYLNDLNGDTKPDLVLADSTGASVLRKSTLNVLINKGTGAFNAPVAAYTNLTDTSLNVTIADLSGDGKPDILLQDNLIIGGKLVTLINKGTGAFNAGVLVFAATAGKLTSYLDDLNGDTKKDIIVSLANPGTTTKPTASVILNKGTGAFNTAALVFTGSLAGASLTIQTADLNGDKKDDLILQEFGLTGGAKISVALNKGTGAFNPAKLVYTATAGNVLALPIDLNLDTKPELVIVTFNPLASTSHATTAVLTNNGLGGFSTASTIYTSTLNGGYLFPFPIDLNGDKKPDFIFLDSSIAAAKVVTKLNTST